MFSVPEIPPLGGLFCCPQDERADVLNMLY